MVQLLKLLCGALIGLFQSSARREAEILVLRQQINVLRRMSPKRPIRVDHVSESPNVADDDRAVLPLPGPARLATQVEEPT